MGQIFTDLFEKKFIRALIVILVQVMLITSSLGASSSSDVLAVARPITQKAQFSSAVIVSLKCSETMGGKRLHQITQVFNIFLPVVERAAPPDEDNQIAIDRVNHYRTLAGVPLLHVNQDIIIAAQNHADYYLLNYADPAAWEYGVHGEVEDKPGFTGQWPRDRMEAADYPYFGSAEVMHFLGDPVASVDDWFSSVYHRVILLEPILTCGGYGKGKNNQTAVDVLDLGIGGNEESLSSTTIPYPLAYPADRQEDVPVAWNGNESPDPLPPGATRPVGYPFTLQGVMGNLVVDWAEMRDSQGQVVAVHPDPSLCHEFNCYAMIPVQPLSARTSYTVMAQGSVGGVAFELSWTFSTGDNTLDAGLDELAGEWVGPSMPSPAITQNAASISSD
jgi:uncharacterized protein YkwD